MYSATQRVATDYSGLWKRAGWLLLLLGAAFAAFNAIYFALSPDFAIPGFGNRDGGIQKERMFSIALIGLTHTLGGAIAALIGPFQFLSALRRRMPRVHVWLGRVYLVSVGLSAIGGLYLAPDSNARNTLGIAFICLALAWLYTGAMAYTTIRRRDVQAHRRWMIRNYALTYAAVTLRFEMPLLILGFGMAPMLALDIVGWACWVPNLLLVEWWITRKRTRTLTPVVGAVS